MRIEHEATESLSAAGDVLPAWKAIPRGLDVPASVTALSGSEQAVGSQQQAIADWEVRMRYRDDVNETMRLVHNGRNLNVVRAFDETGRRRELVFHCKEKKD